MSDSFTCETLTHTQLRKINFLQHFFFVGTFNQKSVSQ